MKKIYKTLLVLFLTLGFAGCSSDTKKEPLSIKWGKENKIDDIMSYQIETIGKPQQIVPDLVEGTYISYQPNKEKNVLLDIVMQITNLKDQELKLNDEIKGVFVIDDVDYIAATAQVSPDGKSLDQTVTLGANGNARVHFYAEVDPDKLNQKIEFKFTADVENGPDIASMKFNLDDINKKYEIKNLNDTLISEGLGKVVLQAVNLTKQIEPANPTGLYTRYPVKEETNTLVVLTTLITNNSGNDLAASSFAFAKLIDSEGKEYPATSFYEKNDHSNISSSSSVTLNNGQTGIVHFAFEVSDDIANGKKTIIITSQGKVYRINA